MHIYVYILYKWYVKRLCVNKETPAGGRIYVLFTFPEPSSAKILIVYNATQGVRN